MKKQNKDWSWQQKLVYTMVVLAVGVLFTVPFLYVVKQQRDSAYNQLANRACQEKQYESQEPLHGMMIECHDKITNISSGGFCKGLVVVYNTSIFSNIQCIEKECVNNPMIYMYNNFTTGRYIDGKIECFAGCPYLENCLRLSNKGMEFCKHNWENHWFAGCEHTQNFTLEELGIKSEKKTENNYDLYCPEGYCFTGVGCESC